MLPSLKEWVPATEENEQEKGEDEPAAKEEMVEEEPHEEEGTYRKIMLKCKST